MALSSRTQPIVSVVTRPDTPTAWIRLIGDIDMAAEPALLKAADRLNVLSPYFIVIDLTAVTFACSTLANFLATLHRTHPRAELILHHPSPLARIVVTLAGLDGVVATSGQPEPPVTAAAATGPAAIEPLTIGHTGNSPDTRGSDRRHVGRPPCVIRHRHAFLRWMARTRPSRRAAPPDPRH